MDLQSVQKFAAKNEKQKKVEKPGKMKRPAHLSEINQKMKGKSYQKNLHGDLLVEL